MFDFSSNGYRDQKAPEQLINDDNRTIAISINYNRSSTSFVMTERGARVFLYEVREGKIGKQ
ncbi:MAG TPA: hypothetical protein VEL11_11340 [Candidatus Bathyarchaeia archaeon]|nr:hypothetical protein [Candidatus Bathyarchaeia archaeon]